MWETPNVLEVDIHSYRAASLTATTNTHTNTFHLNTHTHVFHKNKHTHIHVCALIRPPF